VSKPIRVEDEASAELNDATLWYERRQPGLGRRYLRAVDTTFQHIARMPKAGPPAPRVTPELGVRARPSEAFPTQEGTGEIRVLAIVHDRRRPGYWLSRI